jgi:hypothetical protein
LVTSSKARFCGSTVVKNKKKKRIYDFVMQSISFHYFLESIPTTQPEFPRKVVQLEEGATELGRAWLQVLNWWPQIFSGIRDDRR